MSLARDLVKENPFRSFKVSQSKEGKSLKWITVALLKVSMALLLTRLKWLAWRFRII